MQKMLMMSSVSTPNEPSNEDPVSKFDGGVDLVANNFGQPRQ